VKLNTVRMLSSIDNQQLKHALRLLHNQPPEAIVDAEVPVLLKIDMLASLVPPVRRVAAFKPFGAGYDSSAVHSWVSRRIWEHVKNGKNKDSATMEAYREAVSMLVEVVDAIPERRIDCLHWDDDGDSFTCSNKQFGGAPSLENCLTCPVKKPISQTTAKSPSLLRRATNLAKAGARAVVNIANGDAATVDLGVQKKRIAICRSNGCGFFKEDWCASCGCFLPGKTWGAAEFCPEGLWKAEITTATTMPVVELLNHEIAIRSVVGTDSPVAAAFNDYHVTAAKTNNKPCSCETKLVKIADALAAESPDVLRKIGAVIPGRSAIDVRGTLIPLV
jgi:hypothetical protein